MNDSFLTADGLELGVKRYGYGPLAEGRAVVVGLHGISGCFSDFDPLGDAIAARGMSMLAWNQRGEGLDPRPHCRGDLEDWQHLVGDAQDFFQKVCDEAGGRPVFVCGESMGALVAINAAAKGVFERAAGLVLMSPVVALRGRKPPTWLRVLVWLALRLAPRFRLDPARLAPKNEPPVRIAGDLAHQEARDAAPYRVREFTLRFFRNLIDMTESAAASAGKILLPTLVLYAGNDYFVHPDAVAEFVSQLGSEDKSSQLWPDAYHLLLYDPSTPEVIQTICQWIEDHIR